MMCSDDSRIWIMEGGVLEQDEAEQQARPMAIDARADLFGAFL